MLIAVNLHDILELTKFFTVSVMKKEFFLFSQTASKPLKVFLGKLFGGGINSRNFLIVASSDF